MRTTKSRSWVRDTVFAIAFILLLMLYLWKLPYGWSYTGDESFYLAVPHRFLMGDAPVTHEWNLSQTSGYLLMPIVWLFEIMSGGTEGIILFMRHAYLMLHAAVTLFIYLHLRKEYGWGAVTASLVHFSFIPYHTMALSYNTIPLEMLVVSGLLLAKPGRHADLCSFVAGLCFAAAVLASPLLMLLYAAYALLVLIARISHRKKQTTLKVLTLPLFRGRTFLLFTSACIILAVIVCGWILTHMDLGALAKDLPWLTYEPNHDFDASSLSKVAGYLWALLTGYSSITKPDYLLTACWALLVILCAVILLDRNRDHRKGWYLVSGLLITLILLIDFRRDLSIQYHLIMLPLVFSGVPAFLLCKKKDWSLLFTLAGAGLVFSFTMYLSSNNESFVIVLALTLAGIASVLFVSRAVAELLTDRANPVVRYAPLALSALCIAVLAFSRFQVIRNLTYWDEGTYNIHCELTEGPAKGVKTSEVKEESYNAVMADIHTLQQYPRDQVLFMDISSYPYLALNYPVGSFSPWFEIVHAEKEAGYYVNHPEKVPAYICIPKDAVFDTTPIIASAEQQGYHLYNGSYYLIMIKDTPAGV